MDEMENSSLKGSFEQNTEQPEKELTGMNKVMSVMGQQFNSQDPLILVKQLLNYLNDYADKLMMQRGNPVSKPEPIKTEKYPTLQIVKKEITVKNNEDDVVYPSRKTRWVKNVTQEQQKKKFQQQKFIAFSFIQYGINYHYLTQYYPQMPPKTYRCYVQAINNQTVNQIVNYLRYQCNLQIERLNRDQKRSIRTQLTKIREWLGNRDADQLETFYKFIKRHYDKSIEISMEDALKLYKTVICIIRSPYVNVLEAQEVGDNNETNGERMTQQQEKAMIISFIKWKDLNKVSDLMCQKYGYDMRWSFHSVKFKLKELLNASIDKLIKNFKQTQQQLYKNYFTDKKRELMLQSNEIDLKIKLYSFYLEKRMGYAKIKDLIQKLKEFYAIYAQDSTEAASLPKLQQTQSQSIIKNEPSVFSLDKTVKQKDEEDTISQKREIQIENGLIQIEIKEQQVEQQNED